MRESMRCDDEEEEADRRPSKDSCHRQSNQRPSVASAGAVVSKIASVVNWHSSHDSRFSRSHSGPEDSGEMREMAGMQSEWFQDSLQGWDIFKHQMSTKQIFMDADGMKEKVRQNLTRPNYNVKDHYKREGPFAYLAMSHTFEVITLLIIGLNSIWIAVDTDLNDEEILINAHPVFQIGEHLFCSFFVFELLTRFLAFKFKRDCLKDGWFLFDSGLVLMMVSETWVMSAVALASDAASTSGAANTNVLRVARLLRLTRMARIAKLMRAIPEIMILVKGMLAASRSVLFTFLLLLILMYVFAIALTQLLHETDVGSQHFSSVPKSMYTLWIHGTLRDDINFLQKRLVSDSIPCTVIFFIFVLLASLTVMNMLIGILCEVVSAVAASEKEEILVSYVRDKLRQVLLLIDEDGDSQITKTEFSQILENPEACRCLEDVGVDVLGLIDSVDAIFDDVDCEGKKKTQLSFSKFMEVVLNMRGSNTARVKDMVDLKKYLRGSVENVNLQLAAMQNELRKTRVLMTGQFSSSNLESRRGSCVARSDDSPMVKQGALVPSTQSLPPSTLASTLTGPWAPYQDTRSKCHLPPEAISRRRYSGKEACSSNTSKSVDASGRHAMSTPVGAPSFKDLDAKKAAGNEHVAKTSPSTTAPSTAPKESNETDLTPSLDASRDDLEREQAFIHEIDKDRGEVQACFDAFIEGLECCTCKRVDTSSYDYNDESAFQLHLDESPTDSVNDDTPIVDNGTEGQVPQACRCFFPDDGTVKASPTNVAVTGQSEAKARGL